MYCLFLKANVQVQLYIVYHKNQNYIMRYFNMLLRRFGSGTIF